MNTSIVSAHQQAPVQFNSRPLYKKGSTDVRGTKYTFGGTETPQELRARFKAQGLKGNKLSSAVRGVMLGNQTAAFVETQMFVEFLRTEGFTPAGGQMTARSGSVSFVKVPGSGSAKVSEKAIREAAVNEVLAKLRDLGLDEATIASLQK